jgi:hypothetical protein
MNVKPGELANIQNYVKLDKKGTISGKTHTSNIFISKKYDKSIDDEKIDDIINDEQLKSIKSFIEKESINHDGIQSKIKKNPSYEVSDEEFLELVTKKTKSLNLEKFLK